MLRTAERMVEFFLSSVAVVPNAELLVELENFVTKVMKVVEGGDSKTILYLKQKFQESFNAIYGPPGENDINKFNLVYQQAVKSNASQYAPLFNQLYGMWWGNRLK